MFCPKCGLQQEDGANWCSGCGFELRHISNPSMRAAPAPQPSSSRPVFVQQPLAAPQQVVVVANQQKSRVAYVLLGLFLGVLGIHNFYAGFSGRGIAQLLICLLAGWLVVPIFALWIWNLVEIITVTADAQGVPFN